MPHDQRPVPAPRGCPLKMVLPCLLSVSLLPLFLTGCGVIGKMGRHTVQAAREITGGGWHRKVGVTPLENRSLLPDGPVDRLFQAPFMERLASACPGADFIGEKDKAAAALRHITYDPDGNIPHGTLLALARDHGMQQILQVRAGHMEAEERETGFLLFRDIEYIGRVRISLTLWDTLTGVKLLAETMHREAEIDGMEFDAVNARDPRHLMEIPEMLASLAEEAADRVCGAVHDRDWELVVVSADGKTGVIPAGGNAGIGEGDRMRFYEPGEAVTGRGGRLFLLPGEEIGRGRVIKAGEERSQVRLEGEGTLSPGVRVRP